MLKFYFLIEERWDMLAKIEYEFSQYQTTIIYEFGSS